MSTEATFQRHVRALSEGIDAVMADYTPESVFFTPDGPLRGLAPIRAFLDAFLTASPPELLRAMTVVRLDVDGELAYVLWKAEPFMPIEADTFLVREGKILAQTFARHGAPPAPAGGPAASAGAA